MRHFKKIIAIFGMPRSGTSFVGQIFDSHPAVKFRMEPIFSYALKNQVNQNSTRKDFIQFFEKAWNLDNDYFMTQQENRQKGSYPIFDKNETQNVLVFKTTRFHEILPALLNAFSADELRIVSIVRHPCGAINSWLRNKKEFPAGADPEVEWRTGACRKTAIEEYWGFEDWKKVTKLHEKYARNYSNFKMYQYENIVQDCEKQTLDMFQFCKLDMHVQSTRFIKDAQQKEVNDPYAVYKTKDVAGRWKTQLDNSIQNQIITECSTQGFASYLVENHI